MNLCFEKHLKKNIVHDIKTELLYRYMPRDASMNSEAYYYKKGANQLFSQTSHIFDPTAYNEEDLMYNADREVCVFNIFIYTSCSFFV